MPALHVCYILKRFPRLSQTFVLNELLALQRQDVPVTVVALRRSDEPLARADELRAPVCYLDELTTESSGDSGAQAAAIAPLVSTCGITHIHAHFATRAATVARQVSALTGVPFSFTAHAHDIFHSAIDGVALARTIALDPTLLMYDEPFTGLDPISLGVIGQLIRRLNDALGASSVIVTHDVQESLQIVDYIYFISEGRVVAEGTPEAIRNTSDPFVHQFIHAEADGPVPFHYPAGDYATALTGGAR